MRTILNVIHLRYPHYRAPSTHVHEQVWETVHLPDFDEEAIGLIYRYLLREDESTKRQEKPDFDWLGPNKTLSQKTRDNNLAAARQWAAQEQTRRQAKAHRDRTAVPEPLEEKDNLPPDEWQAIKDEFEREVNEGAKAGRERQEAMAARRKQPEEQRHA